jgi:hypothetical protein
MAFDESKSWYMFLAEVFAALDTGLDKVQVRQSAVAGALRPLE